MKTFSCAALAMALSLPGLAAADPADYFVPDSAGTFTVRLRAIDVIPENLSSSVSAIGGHVAVTKTPAPEVDFSYFLTDHISMELIAASTRHEAAGVGTALGRVDVGSVWVLPPTLTAQYHFAPRERFDPYIGAGVNVTFFYASQPTEPVVQKVGFSNGVGGALEMGADYALGGPWIANIDVKQIFLSTTARATTVLGGVVAKTALDPTVVGIGIGYRF